MGAEIGRPRAPGSPAPDRRRHRCEGERAAGPFAAAHGNRAGGSLSDACLAKPGARVSGGARCSAGPPRSEEHTSALQSLMRISYAVFCLKKKKKTHAPLTNHSVPPFAEHYTRIT